MTDIRDLVAILGDIDTEILSRGDDLRAEVARLVPAYRDPRRVAWYQRLVAHTSGGAFLTIDEAMRNLATGTRYPSMLPRQAMAVALAARVHPERFGPDGTDVEVSLAALGVDGILAGEAWVPLRSDPVVEVTAGPAGPAARRRPAPGTPRDQDRDERAMALLRALADPARLASAEGWHEFLAGVEAAHDQLSTLPRPCTATVVGVPGEGKSISLLQTTLCVTDVSLKKLAATFLDPPSWAHCSEWWLAMRPLERPDPGSRKRRFRRERYLEHVGFPRHDPVFDVSVVLDYDFPVTVKGRRVVTYKPSPEQDDVTAGGLRPNGAVDADRGVIEVRKADGHLHIETSKRIRFTGSIDNDVVAVLACWVGYGDAGTELVCNCSGAKALVPECDVAPPAPDAPGRLAELVGACQADAAAEVKRWANRVEGGYGLRETAEDAVRSVGLVAQSWQKVASTWVAAVADLAATAAPRPGPAQAVGRTFAFSQSLPEGCLLEFAEGPHSPYGEFGEGITIDRSEPGEGGREFRLVAADVSKLDGTAYLGTVRAVAGGEPVAVSHVEADLIVP